MTLRLTKYFLFTLWISSAIAQANDSERFSQMVLSFTKSRAFDYEFYPSQKALVINFKNTITDELKPIYHYDERLVRRVLFREQGQDTEVRIILRDNQVRASLYSFEEPFRIVIDLFDESFEEKRDPQTDYPFVQIDQEPNFDTPTLSAPISRESTTPKSPPLPQADRLGNERNSKKKLLLQPLADDFQSPQELLQRLQGKPEGVGKRWDRYPIYIYRIQTEPYKTGKSYQSWMKENANEAMESSQAMANYASQLFDFGHESRALIAYQKVLHQNPRIFDRVAEHLWKLAEIHLGQGNQILADGYYHSLIEKHPDHPLRYFAEMRRLDLKAIHGIDKSDTQIFPKIANQVEGVRTKDLNELKAQLAIRRAFWQQDQENIKNHIQQSDWLPTLSPEQVIAVENALQTVENPKTGFILSALLLNHTLNNPDQWDLQSSQQAHHFFKTYRGQAAEPYREQLLIRTHEVINAQIQKLVKTGQFLQAIKLYESLPETINPVTQSAETSWAVAEAYRKLQQPLLSRDFYRKSASLTQTVVQKFRAIFWQLEMTQGALDIAIAKNPSSPETLRLRKDLAQIDQACLKLWNDLKEEEQKVTLTEFKPELEAGIKSNSLTFTHPTLLLSAWTQTLGTQTSTTESGDDPVHQNYIGDHTTVSLLSQLAKRFGQIGQESNRRATQELLRYLNPSSMLNKTDATAIWTKELVDLAETYRRNNQYLEAGRLYILTGEKSPNWEGRAEALYKGGLLLYRSGRRDEAIKAFDQAANDGNNLLYAELAKKRLEQLKD